MKFCTLVTYTIAHSYLDTTFATQCEKAARTSCNWSSYLIIMPVDFHLSPPEDGIRKAAAGFAAGPLKDAKKTYMQYQHHHERFQSTRPIYHQAVAGGLIKGQIPPHLGGAGGSLMEAVLLVEEMYRVEPAASLTIFSTGLGLTPMNLTGKPEHKEFLEPFLSGQGEPLASMVFSEPGGVANWLEKGAPGLNTTATLQGDEWVLNGEKVGTIFSLFSSPPLTRSTDLGHQQCWLGFWRRRPPMRRLPEHDPQLRRARWRHHDSPCNNRWHQTQRSRRIQSAPPRLHGRPYRLLRPPHQIHKPPGTRQERPMPTGYRRTHCLGRFRLYRRPSRRHERWHNASCFRRRAGVRKRR